MTALMLRSLLTSAVMASPLLLVYCSPSPPHGCHHRHPLRPPPTPIPFRRLDSFIAGNSSWLLKADYLLRPNCDQADRIRLRCCRYYRRRHRRAAAADRQGVSERAKQWCQEGEKIVKEQGEGKGDRIAKGWEASRDH